MPLYQWPSWADTDGYWRWYWWCRTCLSYSPIIKQLTNGEAEFLNSDVHQNILHISTFLIDWFLSNQIYFAQFFYIIFSFCFVCVLFSNNIYLLFVIWWFVIVDCFCQETGQEYLSALLGNFSMKQVSYCQPTYSRANM